MPAKRKHTRGGYRSSRNQFFNKHDRQNCPLLRQGLKDVDYKDVDLLLRYTSEDGKIRPGRLTGVCSLMQRKLTVAIKRARVLALIPYTDQHSLHSKIQ